MDSVIHLLNNWGLVNRVWELLTSLWIPPLLWIPLSLLHANRDVSKLPLRQGQMAVFTGKVRRISQNLILFSSPPAMGEGVVRLGVAGRSLVVASTYWEGRVPGNWRHPNWWIINTEFILHHLLFKPFFISFFNITRKSLQIVLKQCKKKMFW